MFYRPTPEVYLAKKDRLLKKDGGHNPAAENNGRIFIKNKIIPQFWDNIAAYKLTGNRSRSFLLIHA